jgi:hypothetical protein
MMATVFRVIGAVVAGLGLAFILAVGLELFSAVVHPFPPGFKGTMEETCEHVKRYPHWVLAVGVLAWGFTALASTWTAGRIGNRGCAVVVGLLLVLAVVCNVSMLPYPLWFKIASLIVIPIAVLLGVYYSG